MIQYQWPELDPTAPVPVLQLPSRLDASRGVATVKLLVDEWGGA